MYRVSPLGEFELLHAFVTDGGTGPLCALVESPAGTLIGTTGDGGASGGGTAFSSDTSGQVTYLHDFAGAVDGSYPAQGVFAANDGFFYGVTMADGAEGYGTFYRMDSTGSVTVLRDFTEAEGGAPFQIAPGAGGVFYGSNRTAVVKLDTSGTLTPVHDLPGAGYALDRVVQGTDGDLYGSTFHGGATGEFGMVYRATTDGSTFTTLHDFTGIEGAFPVGRLLETSDGKFYGSTNGGRISHGYGTLYRIDPSGQFEVLYSFGSGGDAQYGTTLIEASDGYLYGACSTPAALSRSARFSGWTRTGM